MSGLSRALLVFSFLLALLYASAAWSQAVVYWDPFPPGPMNPTPNLFALDLFIETTDGNTYPWTAIDVLIEWDPSFISADLGVNTIVDPDGVLVGCLSLADYLAQIDGVNDDLDDGDAYLTFLALVGCEISPTPIRLATMFFTFENQPTDPITSISLDGVTGPVGLGTTRALFCCPVVDYVDGNVINNDYYITENYERGDADGSGGVPTLGDTTYLINYFYMGGPTPPCLEAANANGDPYNDLSDIVYLLDYLFSMGPPPPFPFNNCFYDASDTLGCLATSCP